MQAEHSVTIYIVVVRISISVLLLLGAVSPTSSSLAIFSLALVRIWDADTGALQRTLDGHQTGSGRLLS
jgi:hypothetical protein